MCSRCSSLSISPLIIWLWLLPFPPSPFPSKHATYMYCSCCTLSPFITFTSSNPHLTAHSVINYINYLHFILPLPPPPPPHLCTNSLRNRHNFTVFFKLLNQRHFRTVSMHVTIKFPFITAYDMQLFFESLIIELTNHSKIIFSNSHAQ